MATLLSELARVCDDLPLLAGRALATIYFGGGTPSLLRPASVERIVAAIRAAFSGEPEEVTLELNPGDLPAEEVARYVASGVTRLSIGAQSFQDGTLRRLGRAHAAGQALRAVEAGLAAYPTLSIDLIYAAPGQDEDDVARDLEVVTGLAVPHVSAYALTLEPGTPFATAGAAGRLPLPDEDCGWRMASRVRAGLEAAGLARYEISSYARPGQRSRHNQRYWLRDDVLGLGPSAASLLGDRRFQNLREAGPWRAAIDRGERGLLSDERLSEREAEAEALGLGLRRVEGVSRALFLRRYGRPPERSFGRELAELRALGLVEDAQGRIRLTERGLRFADEAFLRFVGVDSAAPGAS